MGNNNSILYLLQNFLLTRFLNAYIIDVISDKAFIYSYVNNSIVNDDVPSKVKEKETEYKDPSILNNAELIDLYKNILSHINYLNENIINLDEGGESNE